MNNYETLLAVQKSTHKHEKFIKVLINLVNRSQARCKQMWDQYIPMEHCVPNANCMVIGKSGTGKTHTIETVCRIMKIHLVTVDATQLAPTSASGLTQAKLIDQIVESAKDHFNAAPKYFYRNYEEVLDQTIVFVDEMDKLSQEFSNSNWQQHTQSNFLTLFENKVEGLESLSWVFAGAFSSLMKNKTTEKKRSIGFNGVIDDILKDWDIEKEIIKYGLLPELVGRIHQVVELDEFVIEDYRKILETLIIPKKKAQLKALGADSTQLDTLDIEEVCKKAMKSEQGVRALTKAIDSFLIDVEFYQAPPFELLKAPDTICATGFNHDILTGNK